MSTAEAKNDLERNFFDLAPLETFNPRAFISEDKETQDICGFVLSLAVAYNDFKDILMAISLIDSVRLKGPYTPTPRWGQYGGVREHLMRRAVWVLRKK